MQSSSRNRQEQCKNLNVMPIDKLIIKKVFNVYVIIFVTTGEKVKQM